LAQNRSTAAFALILTGFFGLLLNGCSGGGGSKTPPPPLPSIQNVNSSTTPTSPVGYPIEINGSGFQGAPGKVTFTQGSSSTDVTPATSAWSDTGVVVTVPSTLTASSVTVTVTTSGGTSNAVTLNLIPTLNFNPSAMAWGTTIALPKALTGLRAIAVPGTSPSTAFAVVTGGFDGTANTNTVWSINLNQDGTVGNSTNITWTKISTNPLPVTLAHHAMAEADDTNSLVAAGKRYLYILGGQVNVTDTAGGTNTVYIASIDSTTGAVGTWTASTNTLPKSLFGLTATVHNGYLYVAGGLDTTGTPVRDVYSAPINSDGTIGAWVTSTNVLPSARSFGGMAVFGGIIYYIGGDPNTSILPNNQAVGDKSVYYASAIRGTVGVWTVNGSQTIHDRSKGVLFSAYGQMIAAEGVYNGSVGSGEMESASVNAQNTGNNALNSFNGLTGSSAPKANVYNAAGFTSPLFAPATNGPRFLLLGGEASTGTTGPGGTPSTTVYYNTMP
jgi:hypothetical protein